MKQLRGQVNNILLYADDIVLIAEYENTIRETLNIVNDNINEFIMSFNSNKCGVMDIKASA